jgi:hypothetical protein
MKKRSRLNSIQVKDPCSQDWNKMFGNDKVRFCEHCVKNVHDLSAMTRKKAEALVARSKGGICVRYIRRPDGDIQTVSDKLYQISGRASRLAASVFGASLTLASSIYAQQEKTISSLPAVERAIAPDQQKNAPKEQTPGSISGILTDTSGAVIPGAKVTLTDQKSGRETTVSTNDEGCYIFSAVKEGEYKLKFELPGFSDTEIDNVNFDGQIGAKYNATLRLGMIMGDMIAVVSYENQLVLAVHDNDIERVKQLIGQGVDVNAKDKNEGEAALHLAVQQGEINIVELLLNAGARANSRDRSRRTPLMLIAEDYESEEDESESRPSQAAEIFRLLIAHGAKVDLLDSEGMSALMYAARNESPALLRLLITHKADVDLQAKNGRTALMEAVDVGETENVKLLLEAGANVDLKDEDDGSALSLCTDSEIQSLLTSYGAHEEERKEEEPQDEPDAN